MASEFTMPKLGLTMEEGTILQWLVPDGGEVTAGMPVLVVQTDKVETEVECPGSGRLAQSGVVGTAYPCGEPIGWILAEGETAPTTATPASPVAASAASAEPAPSDVVGPAPSAARVSNGGRQFVSPNARRVATQLGVDVTTLHGTGPNGRVVSEDVEAAAAAGAVAPSGTAAVVGRAPASVAASQLADLVGVDLGRTPITASSPDGRISRQDVADHVRTALTSPAAAPGSPAPVTPGHVVFPLTQTPSATIPMRGMRGTIASRMHQSLQQMAQLTLTMDVDMDAVWADRERRKAAGTPPGFTDYVIAAVAQALRAFPTMNSQVTPDGVAVLPDIHVGMAVALDGGLVVPVVRHTDRLRLDAIGAETTRLATAARAGKLGLADLEGGTFSVTSLGMYGVDAFTPVINPPNAGILGVGRIRDEVVWVGDAIRRARRMTLSLTWDHRVLDGAPAAEFCQAVKVNLEDPSRIP
jgi:pyruvate dehydrogenase E2 component (dihydrolipoamide acetyltransferase)